MINYTTAFKVTFSDFNENECCLYVTEPGLLNVALHVGLGTYISCVYAQVINKVCDWIDLV